MEDELIRRVLNPFHWFSSTGRTEFPTWLVKADKNSAGKPELELVKRLKTYYQRDKRKYAHFVGGGITDNLGLRTLYEIVGDVRRKLEIQSAHSIAV